ncbi:MAG: ABC transporter ATP-binding protein [Planctomycetales bacterium]|nr:ABC transporter ATP-binding protein [Planctomycetales bacterium]MBN8627593.1 ABC transporter ATP-binding protein [Planctomycetota bacterium]
MANPLLQVENLTVEFRTDDGVVRAVNDVSFHVEAGETLGVAGESGSGKSVTNLAMLRLIPTPPGRIVGGRALFKGEDLLTMTSERLRKIRGRHIAMIFQDPMTSLNPLMTVADQLTEVTRLHLGHTAKQARDHAVTMLERVGIPAAARRVNDYPHQFSGGMRQRVMIAMALSCKPEVLIADEPTTALDVTIQAQILELIRELQEQQGTAVILITHDLGVMANSCRRVAVMYAGRIVEEAPVDALFYHPRHPYTLGLLNSRPKLEADGSSKLQPIAGQPPNLADLPAGCAFHPRCPFAIERCRTERPLLRPAPTGNLFACHVDVTTAVPHLPQAAEVRT